MSLPTDPFAAPSSGPLALGPGRAEDERAAGLSRRRALAVVTGTLAVGAAAVGVALGVDGGTDLTSAASSVAPAAGAAATLAPPAVGAPIVPKDPTPSPVTTRPTPVADSMPTTRAPTTTRATPDRQEQAQALAAMRARAAQRYEQAWEQWLEPATVPGAGARGHGQGHHR